MDEFYVHRRRSPGLTRRKSAPVNPVKVKNTSLNQPSFHASVNGHPLDLGVKPANKKEVKRAKGAESKIIKSAVFKS